MGSKKTDKTKRNVKSSNLRRAYYDVKNTGSYGGVRRLVDSIGKTTNTSTAKRWLSTQSPYSLHKPIRKKFPTRKYMVSGVDELWQLDLLEMIPYAKINKGYKYILTCIDVFSRYARALPAKSKNGEEIASLMTKMFKVTYPHKIQTDRGKEFYNAHVQKLLKSLDIEHYTVNSQFKAPHVERFNRTVREKLTRLFTHKGNKIWINDLVNLVDTYNRTKHRGINNRRPVDVNKENEAELWQTQEKERLKREQTATSQVAYRLMDLVRISRISSHQTFIKNFDQNWSEEIFRIVAVDTSTKPTMYVIEDMEHNVIEGKFYKHELQVVDTKPEEYRIEKVIRTRGTGKNKEHLVKWYGYDSKHNSWIKASSINKPSKR